MKLAILLFSLLLCSAGFAQSPTEIHPEHRAEINALVELRTQSESFFERERTKPRNPGQPSFLELVDLGKMKYEGPKGDSRLTYIDGEIVEALQPKGTNKLYVFVDKNKISKLSNHLLYKYVPRQHIDRKREVILVWTDNEKLESVEHKPLPTAGSKGWWQAYYQATFQKPTSADVKFGIFSAGVQVAVAGGVSGAKVALDPSAEFLMAPMALNAVFGTVIGTYASTYRNWVYRHGTSRFRQMAKSSVVSLAFATSLVMATSSSISSMNMVSLSALAMTAWMASNVIGNNYAKTEWAQWANVFKEEGKDRKEVVIKLPFKKDSWKTGINWSKMNFQIFSYLPVNALRTADIIGLTFGGVPIGTLALWGSIPAVRYATLKWAEKFHPDSAKKLKMREAWENMLKFPARLPRRIIETPSKMIRRYNIHRCLRTGSGVASR